jgi:Mn2+/Fe2+ NRAMP family transporter
MLQTIKEKLGPGLLYAAAAVGVSHLVSSTTAGATYGLIMLAYVLFVCLVKYPTFLFGARYAAATGEDLVVGYSRMGKWVVVLFFIMQLFEYTFAIAGVSVTSAAIIRSVFDLGPTLFGLSYGLELLLILSCIALLAVGRYSALEDFSKFLVIAFTLTTVIATAVAIGGIDSEGASLSANMSLDMPTVLFLIAVAGWMPTGTAGSVGLSLWVKAKSIRLNRPVTTQEATFDFNVGYGTAIFTAGCFVALGTMVMYIQGVPVAGGGAAFADQLMGLFTTTIGGWVYPIIAAAAITVMYSSLITLVDLLPRSSAAALGKIAPVQLESKFGTIYYIFLGVELFIVGCVLAILMDQFSTFIGMVTSMGFIVAPIFSLLNHMAMFGPQVALQDRPSNFLKYWSYGTITILTAVALVYVYFTWINPGA